MNKDARKIKKLNKKCFQDTEFPIFEKESALIN